MIRPSAPHFGQTASTVKQKPGGNTHPHPRPASENKPCSDLFRLRLLESLGSHPIKPPQEIGVALAPKSFRHSIRHINRHLFVKTRKRPHHPDISAGRHIIHTPAPTHAPLSHRTHEAYRIPVASLCNQAQAAIRIVPRPHIAEANILRIVIAHETGAGIKFPAADTATSFSPILHLSQVW